ETSLAGGGRRLPLSFIPPKPARWGGVDLEGYGSKSRESRSLPLCRRVVGRGATSRSRQISDASRFAWPPVQNWDLDLGHTPSKRLKQLAAGPLPPKQLRANPRGPPALYPPRPSLVS